MVEVRAATVGDSLLVNQLVWLVIVDGRRVDSLLSEDRAMRVAGRIRGSTRKLGASAIVQTRSARARFLDLKL